MLFLVLQRRLSLVNQWCEKISHKDREEDYEAQFAQLTVHDDLHQEYLVAEEETRG